MPSPDHVIDEREAQCRDERCARVHHEKTDEITEDIDRSDSIGVDPGEDPDEYRAWYRQPGQGQRQTRSRHRPGSAAADQTSTRHPEPERHQDQPQHKTGVQVRPRLRRNAHEHSSKVDAPQRNTRQSGYDARRQTHAREHSYIEQPNITPC